MAGVIKETQEYNKALLEQGLIKCSDCKEIKPLDDFYTDSNRSSGYQSLCKRCLFKFNKKRIDRNRTDLNVIKEAQGCTICGFNEDGIKLHFHHRDKSTKLFSVARNLNCSQQTLQEEIDKCEVLCASCHATYHNYHP